MVITPLALCCGWIRAGAEGAQPWLGRLEALEKMLRNVGGMEE